MKTLLISVFTLCLISCSTKSPDVKENRIEITPFLLNRAILRDTTTIKDVYKNVLGIDSANVPIFCYDNIYGQTGMYMNAVEFNQLTVGLKYMMSDPDSKIYINPDSAAISYHRVRNLMCKCDSVLEASYDANGKETITRSFRCDSVSMYYNINSIVFYESWYFNKETHMIDKEILGYSVQEYIDKRKAFKELFIVFRDEKAREKVNKYYFINY